MNRLAIVVLAGALAAGCPGDVTCNVPRDCPVAQRCVNNVCVDPAGTPGALGEACTNDGECTAGLTCALPAQGYPGGFCTAACTATPNTCASGTCTPIGGEPLCAPGCTTDAACRQGYACCATLNDTCVPLAACPPAQCTRPVQPSTLQAPGQVQEFGTRKVGEEVVFTVPPNTGSITILHQAQIATLDIVFQDSVVDNSAVPLRITKPDGTLAYDDLAALPPPSPDGGVDLSGNYAVYSGSTPSTAAFTIPNSSASLAAGIPEGSWKFVVNDFANECTFVQGCSDGGTTINTYDVKVLTRPVPASATGTLNVDFYIVADMLDSNGAPFTAANAPGDPRVIRMMSTFNLLMTNAGLTTNIRFWDTSAAQRARFGTNISAQATGACSELNQMFTISGEHPGNTMNIFLVQSLRSADSSGGSIVGIDGTIPGPSTVNGTVNSGAVVVAADLFSGTCGAAPNIGACGADKVAFTAAHETGHFLGLFHTTELEGADFDPLTDTPKCPCLPCADATNIGRCGSSAGPSPVLPAGRCISPPGCDGGTNLMFWQLSPGVSQGFVTSEQRAVIAVNPLVQ